MSSTTNRVQEPRGWRRIAALIAAMLVPFLVGGFAAAAFGNADEELHRIPAAVVNEDQIVMVEGEDGEEEPMFAGRQLVTDLNSADTPAFDWQVTSREDAENKLASGEVYAIITIPEDFTERVLSLESDNPKQAGITVRTDGIHDYLSPSLAAEVARQVANTFGETVTNTFISSVFSGMGQIVDAFEQAADGAGQLGEGAGELRSGLNELGDGANTLADGLGQAADAAGQLDDGAQRLNGAVGELASGANELSDGAHRLADGTNALVGGLEQAQGGVGELDSGAQQLAQGVTQYTEGVDQLAAGLSQLASPELPPELQEQIGIVQQLVGELQALIPNFPEMTLEEVQAALERIAGLGAGLDPSVFQGLPDQIQQAVAGVEQLVAGAQQLSAQSPALRDGANQLAGGTAQLNGQFGEAVGSVQQLSDGANELAGGIDTLAGGAGQLQDGAAALADGTDQLGSALGQLSEGSTTLANGVQEAADATGQLEDGANELSTRLREGADELPTKTEDEIDQLAEVATSPVGVTDAAGEQRLLAQVAAIAIPVAAWLGTLVLTWLVRPLNATLTARRASVGGTLGSFALRVLPWALGQSLLLVLLTHTVFQVPWSEIGGTAAVIVLFSLVGILLHGALVTLLGRSSLIVSMLLAIVMFVLAPGALPTSLFGSAGGAIAQALPLTHGIRGMKSFVLQGAGDSAGTAIFALVVLALLNLALLAWSISRAGAKRAEALLQAAHA